MVVPSSLTYTGFALPCMLSTRYGYVTRGCDRIAE